MKKLRAAALLVAVGVSALGSAPTLALASPPEIEPTHQEISLPGSPFAVVTTPDGKYAFSSENGSASGIAVFEQEGTSTTQIGTIQTEDPAYGLAITSNGEYLLAAVRKLTGDPLPAGVEIIDVKKAIAGESGAVLGDIQVTAKSGPIEVSLSNDDNYAFVSDEDNETVGVIDLEEALASGVSASDVVGYIPVDSTPVGLALSPDGKYLYVSNELATSKDPGYDANSCEVPASEESETRAPGPEGSLTIVNLQEAETNPDDSVITTVLAGCQPVRVDLSNNGEVAWVTDRSSDEIAAYSTERLLTDPEDALISETPVGESPVGLQFFDDGQLIAVANSNRFATVPTGTVSILDARRALRGEGESATLGTFAAGEFPRQFGLSPDEEVLYLTEYSSDTLAIFPVAELVSTLHPVNEFELALTSSGNGSGTLSCKVKGGPEEPCVVEYEEAAEVEVIPHAATGSEFAGWGSDCTGTGACLLKIDTDESVSAVFNQAATVTQGGGSGGSGENGAGGSGGAGGGNGTSGSGSSSGVASTSGRGSSGSEGSGSSKPATIKLRSTKVHRSSATLAVTVSGKGVATASGKGVATVKVTAKNAQTVKLKLELTRAGKKTLAKKGKVKVKVKVVFTPASSSPQSITTTVTFKAKKKS